MKKILIFNLLMIKGYNKSYNDIKIKYRILLHKELNNTGTLPKNSVNASFASLDNMQVR